MDEIKYFFGNFFEKEYIAFGMNDLFIRIYRKDGYDVITDTLIKHVISLGYYFVAVSLDDGKIYALFHEKTCIGDD